jgi:hypothetical protein
VYILQEGDLTEGEGLCVNCLLVWGRLMLCVELLVWGRLMLCVEMLAAGTGTGTAVSADQFILGSKKCCCASVSVHQNTFV